MTTRAPVPSFPTPGESYSAQNEAQFRQSVERVIQTVIYAQEDRVGSVTFGTTEDDYDAGRGTTALRVTPNAAGSTLSGVAGGRSGRSLRVVNVGSTNLVLAHASASSVAGNRLLAETGADVTLGANDAADLWYDATTERWRIFPLT